MGKCDDRRLHLPDANFFRASLKRTEALILARDHASLFIRSLVSLWVLATGGEFSTNKATDAEPGRKSMTVAQREKLYVLFPEKIVYDMDQVR